MCLADDVKFMPAVAKFNRPLDLAAVARVNPITGRKVADKDIPGLGAWLLVDNTTPCRDDIPHLGSRAVGAAAGNDELGAGVADGRCWLRNGQGSRKILDPLFIRSKSTKRFHDPGEFIPFGIINDAIRKDGIEPFFQKIEREYGFAIKVGRYPSTKHRGLLVGDNPVDQYPSA